MDWIKSSYSFAKQNCVEVATIPVVAVRDSKDEGTGPVLAFTREQWRVFLSRFGR